MNHLQGNVNTGIPYQDVNWYDMEGQPFGSASYFNAMILEDADNIVDTKGAMAVGGNFTSKRGLSLGYGNDSSLKDTGYHPDLVRFLVGGAAAVQGPLVVIGHVVTGGSSKVARGSTYMIGKDGTMYQEQVLADLYKADGGSRYWKPSNRSDYFAVSSYDTPRYIPAERIHADVTRFFQDAKNSISKYKQCIETLNPEGKVIEQPNAWILSGTNPIQNVFDIDVSPNGILGKEIRLDIPGDSLAIIRLRTSKQALINYGLWGSEARANKTLYIFEDAEDIRMNVPAAIWGSILAPQAEYYAHPTGGTVYGNAVLRSLHVNPGSGFEFHWYPFVGGVMCRPIAQSPTPVPEVIQVQPIQPSPQPVPEAPRVEPAPLQEAPEIEAPSVPVREQPPLNSNPSTPSCPECPPQIPCAAPEPCPAPEACPPQTPCPVQVPCPPPLECPAQIPCPTPEPCPACPECPPQKPCPICHKPTVKIQPIPIPVPVPYTEPMECEECRVIPDLIYGCIWGCECNHHNKWEVRLYQCVCDDKKLLCCTQICGCGCFEFKVPYEGHYFLVVKAVESSRRCHKHRNSCRPCISLKNVGVANLTVE